MSRTENVLSRFPGVLIADSTATRLYGRCKLTGDRSNVVYRTTALDPSPTPRDPLHRAAAHITNGEHPFHVLESRGSVSRRAVRSVTAGQ